MKLFPLHLIPASPNVNFMRLRWFSIGLAVALALIATAAMTVKGFNYALDFTGGTLVELRFDRAADVDHVRDQMAEAGYEGAQVQTYGSGSDLLVRLQTEESTAAASNAAAKAVLEAVNSVDNPVHVTRSEFVGPQVGKDLARNAVWALLFVIVGFLIYIAMRFEWKFAIAAIATTMHDVLIVAGFFALTGREFDLTVLAGLLAVMGFSINDTIVVFDRVRENFRNLRVEPVELLNRSINQTLSRTIITSFVAFLSALALYLYGGGSLEGMALAQMMGIVIGTASSIFIACPLLTIGFLRVSKQDLMPKAKDLEALARRP